MWEVTAQEGKVLASDLTPSFIKLLTTTPPPASPASFPFCLSCSLVTTPVSRRPSADFSRGLPSGVHFKQEFLETEELPDPQQILQWWNFRHHSIWMEEILQGPGGRWDAGSLPSTFRSQHPGSRPPPVRSPRLSVRAPVPAGGRQPGAARSAFQFKCPPGFAVSDRDRVSGS